MRRGWAASVLAIAGCALVAAGCGSLPEPESAGAKLYQRRCVGCHRLFHPGTLTAEMWVVQVDRMQEQLRRRGIDPLTEEERRVILGYLAKHSQGSQDPSVDVGSHFNSNRGDRGQGGD